MKTIFKFFRDASAEELIDVFDSTDIDDICSKHSSAEIISKIYNYLYYPEAYSVFWLDGTKEIIEGGGLDFDDALRRAGRNKRAVDFYLSYNGIDEYQWDNTRKRWVKQENTNGRNR